MKKIYKIYASLLFASLLIISGFGYLPQFSQKNTSKNNNLPPEKHSQKKIPEGYNYITNFNFTNSSYFQNRFIAQDKNSKIILSNERGILVFDGINEKEYFFDNEILFLEKDISTLNIFAGSINSFGIISETPNYGYEFKPLFTDNSLNENFDRIIFFDNKAWFYGKKYVYSVSLKNISEVKKEFEAENSEIKGIISHKENLFLLASGQKPFNLIKKQFKTIKNYESVAENKILFCVKSGSQTLFGNELNNLYLFDGTEFYRYKIKNQDYLEESVIVGGLEIDKNLFAVYTLNGGAIIINKQLRETVETVNYRTGLPEDEIYSAMLDENKGLWLTHESGASRIAVEMPLKKFSDYPGLDGKINDLIFFDNTVFAATGKGVYYLREIKNYTQIEKIVKVKNESNDKQSGFFSKLFSTKKTSDSNSKSVRKKTIELQSVKYSYLKLNDINSKCKQLKEFDNGLLAATNAGLYFTRNDSVKLIIPEINVHQISDINDSLSIFAASDKGIFEIKKEGKTYSYKKIETKQNQEFFSVITDQNTVWAGGINNVLRIEINYADTTTSSKLYDLNLRFPEKIKLKKVNNKILIFSGEIVYEYSGKQIIKNEKLSNAVTYGTETYFPNNNSLILIKNGKVDLSENKQFKNNNINLINLFKNYENLIFDKQNNIWVITENNEIYKISSEQKPKPEFKIFIENISLISGETLNKQGVITLKYNNDKIDIILSAPDYLRRNQVKFFYSIDDQNPESFTVSTDNQISVSHLGYRNHTIRFYAVNSFNEKSNVIETQIFIKPPFWNSVYFYLALFAIVFGLTAAMFWLYNKKKQQKIIRRNQELEDEVEFRTAKIKLQNEEIKAQNDEILLINKKISEQNKEITDSINYAAKIQTAVLTTPEILNNYVSEYFIINKPRDIVSGDFYWVKESGGKIIIAVADCTGHGVPGGFLSMLGLSSLSDIVHLAEISGHTINAAYILNNLREKIIASLRIHQDYNANDGMDISLIIFDKNKNQIDFSGANNPITIIKNNELTEIKADRMPIGASRKTGTPFTAKTIDINKGDLLYLSTDGFRDQFGGDKERKFSQAKINELLFEIKNQTLDNQKKIMEEAFNKWKGKTFQVDDVLIFGIRF